MRPSTQIQIEQEIPKYYVPNYDGLPEEEIRYDEFEELCRDRLKLLRGIEDYYSSISEEGYKLKDYLSLIRENKLYDGGISEPGKPITDRRINEIRRDKISHFLLRLGFCRMEENKRWLIEQEARLFKIRLQKAIKDSNRPEEVLMKLQEIFKSDSSNKFKIQQLKTDEWEQIKKIAGDYLEDTVSGQMYKVHFTLASGELSKRKSFLKAGFIYLTAEEATYTFISPFKAQLAEALDLCTKFFPNITEQYENIRPLLLNLPNMQTTKNYADTVKVSQGKIKLVDIDALSERSFPLCMTELHQHLRKEHSLKHSGRLQYGLFLKGIGVSLDDSLEFFRKEFTKKIPDAKFNKEYAYSIRFNYGKEGKKADYTPWNCGKIANLNPPGINEQHGCPYKHYSESKIEAILRNRFRLDNDQIREVLDKKRGHHYPIACKRVFQALHPNAKVLDNVGAHPNAYFEASQEYLKAKKPEK